MYVVGLLLLLCYWLHCFFSYCISFLLAAVEEPAAPVIPVANISSILKAKSKSSGGAAKKAAVVSEAQKLAAAEALKVEKQKKKRDKSKFNETSY